MNSTTTTRLRGLALAATTTVALLGTTLPAQAAPDYEIRVASLEEGPPPEVPVLVGHRIHDGDLRVPLEGFDWVRLLGTVGDSYVVEGIRSSASGATVSRVATDGTTTPVTTGHDNIELSDDGTRIAVSRQRRRGSVIRVLDTGTGDTLARSSFGPWTSVLDVDGNRVVTAAWGRSRTTMWRYRTDRKRTLVRRPGQFADLSSGVFSYYTGDPYDGGCTEMARIAAPRRVTWRSCHERIIDISPGGNRMLTTHVLADGAGPSKVTLRRTAGRKLADFRASALFWTWTFEDDHDLLLETSNRRRIAWVRASEDGVERVTPLRRAPQL